MTLGVVFAANRLSGFIPSANAIDFTSDGRYWDGNYTGSALAWNSSAPYGESILGILLDPTTGLQTSLNGNYGLHFDFFIPWNNAYPNPSTFWQFETSAGVPILRGITTTFNTNPVGFKVQYWNGSTWVDTGATYFCNPLNSGGARVTVDIIGTFGASGSCSTFVNNTLQNNGVIASAACTGAAQLRIFQPYNLGNTQMVSQVLVKDGSTLNRKVGRRTLLATGNYTQFAGSSVSNLTDSNDATYMTDNTNGNKSSFTMSQLSVTPSSFMRIEALVVSARVNRDTSGTQNLKFFCREGSTDYALAYNAIQPNIGFEGRLGIFTKDPATSADWAIAAANATTLEIGIQDVT